MSIKKLLSSMTLASILSIAGGLTTTSVFAAEYKDPEPLPQDSTIYEVFFGDVDDDRVLPMPDGGFLHGEIIEVDAEDPSKVLNIYNSRLDPNAVTVEEAKKILSGEKSYVSFSPRGATPPTGWSMKILAANDYYASATFSGSGWRFSNYMFRPADGTGYYLRWTSYNDGGRVGSYDNAVNTLNGNTQGMELQAGVASYFSNGYSGQVYYTYNPAPDTFYRVENK